MIRQIKNANGHLGNDEVMSFRSPQAAQALAKCVFARIKETNSCDDLRQILNHPTYGQYLQKYLYQNKFPRLQHCFIDKKQIVELQDAGIINEDMRFSYDLTTGVVGKKDNTRDLTTLERLLFAMIWKNGDLGKEHHLIKGIKGETHSGQHGYVFHKFGGYLSNSHSYILDQHTLRSFVVYKAKGDDEIKMAQRLESISGTSDKHLDWINAYDCFYTNLSNRLACSAEEKSDFLYLADRLLFAVGKLIKNKNR